MVFLRFINLYWLEIPWIRVDDQQRLFLVLEEIAIANDNFIMVRKRIKTITLKQLKIINRWFLTITQVKYILLEVSRKQYQTKKLLLGIFVERWNKINDIGRTIKHKKNIQRKDWLIIDDKSSKAYLSAVSPSNNILKTGVLALNSSVCNLIKMMNHIKRSKRI